MLVFKVLFPPGRVRVYKSSLDKISPCTLRISNGEPRSRCSSVTINHEEIKLDWDTKLDDLEESKISLINTLRKKGKHDDALTRGYYLICDSVATNNGYKQIKAELLVKTLLNLSRVYQNINNWKLAQDYASFACELDPENVTAHLSAAISLRDSDQPNGLFESFPYAEEAVIINPDDIRARSTLAITYRQVRLSELALEHAEYALELERLKPSHKRQASSYITLVSVLIDLANKHTQLEDFPQAKVYYSWANQILELGGKELQGYEYNNYIKLKEIIFDTLHEKILEEHFRQIA